MSTTDYPHLRKLLSDAERGEWTSLENQDFYQANREFNFLQHSQNQLSSRPEALENILQYVKRKNWSALTKSRIKTAYRDFEELLNGVQILQRTARNELPEPPSCGGVSDTSRTSKSEQKDLGLFGDYPIDDMASVSSRQSHNGYPDEHRHKEKSEMEKTIKSQKVQIDQMANRMSKMASQKQRTNNPNMADLSHDNRPTKIAEKCSELYDSLWAAAFEDMSRNMSEIDTIYNLLRIVRYAYKFCHDVADEQLRAMEKSLQEIMLYPEKFHRPDSRMNYQSTKPDSVALNTADTKSSYFATEYRRETALASVSGIKKLFIFESLPQIYKRNISPKIQQYAERCAELTWYMVVQDPAVELYVLDEGHVETDFFTFYTMRGTQVQYCVWPALRLHKNGSCLTKGVVQAK